jgi:hypothetical protein
VTGDGVTDGQNRERLLDCLFTAPCEAAAYAQTLYYLHTAALGTPLRVTDSAYGIGVRSVARLSTSLGGACGQGT